MAELIIHSEKIKQNIRYLSNYFELRKIQWSLITKVFSGDMEFLKNILTDDVVQNIGSVGDSRLSSLKNLRKVNPNLKTIYIKPPAKIYADEVVNYADISLNSSFSTIEALNKAASKVGKIHEVIIMIELGELREGVKQANLMDFYERVFRLPNIRVIGLGSNLGCMYGVEPTHDKLMQLCLYKELIATKFNKNLSLVSGGTSITLPLVENGQIPKEINHFRVGEAVFFGKSPLDNEQFKDLHTDTFEFNANIIELEEKRTVPDGVISEGAVGHTAEIDSSNNNDKSYKAILDFGMLDVDNQDITPVDREITFVGITSDMIVTDIGSNRTPDGKVKYKVGDKMRFNVNYMATARLLNSKFIEKRFEN